MKTKVVIGRQLPIQKTVNQTNDKQRKIREDKKNAVRATKVLVFPGPFRFLFDADTQQ